MNSRNNSFTSQSCGDVPPSASWQRKRAPSGLWQESSKFWRVVGRPPLRTGGGKGGRRNPLPADRADRALRSSAGSAVAQTLPRETQRPGGQRLREREPGRRVPAHPAVAWAPQMRRRKERPEGPLAAACSRWAGTRSRASSMKTRDDKRDREALFDEGLPGIRRDRGMVTGVLDGLTNRAY